MQNCFAQNSFFFSGGSQIINAKNLNFSNSHPFSLDVGYQNSKHLFGFSTAMNLVINSYNKTDILTKVESNSTYYDSRNVSVRNGYIGVSIGPTINFSLPDFLLFKIIPSINFGSIYSKADYVDKRVYITPIENNKYINNKEEIISQQFKSDSKFTGFLDIGFGADLAPSNLPLGIQLGWQGLDFGKSMNNLNPEGKYANYKFSTSTSAIYAKLFFYLRKKDD